MFKKRKQFLFFNSLVYLLYNYILIMYAKWKWSYKNMSKKNKKNNIYTQENKWFYIYLFQL